MARTSVDLAREVLKELRILAPDETPSAADQNDVTARYRDTVAELEHIGILAIDPEAIPDQYFRPLVGIVAARSAGIFGREYMTEESAMAALRRVTQLPYSGGPLELSTY